MSRGRTDANPATRQHRSIAGLNFYGNSSVISRACDAFFESRGHPATGSLRDLMSAEVAAARRKIGRCLRENKADLAAEEIEKSWRT